MNSELMKLAGDTAAALLFIQSGTSAIDIFSATNSSPWTAYKFANDEEGVEALKKYVAHGIGMTAIMNVGGAIIAKSWWPIVGAGILTTYMVWLYYDAVTTGKEKGSESWASEK